MTIIVCVAPHGARPADLPYLVTCWMREAARRRFGALFDSIRPVGARVKLASGRPAGDDGGMHIARALTRACPSSQRS